MKMTYVPHQELSHFDRFSKPVDNGHTAGRCDGPVVFYRKMDFHHALDFGAHVLSNPIQPTTTEFRHSAEQAEENTEEHALVHVFKIYLTANYNYDFKSRPVDFRWDEINSNNSRHRALTCVAAAAGVWLLRSGSTRLASHGRVSRAPLLCGLHQIKELPGQLASYILAHSFGRWLIYPGSMCLMTKALLPLLLQGQARLVEQFHGRRAKLEACDGNEIDTMFMDRRGHPGPDGRGRQLVICCEGNAGFYEMGCLWAPLEAGYSVLGWNHPGFAGSTGAPFPQQDANAMDVVIKYALHRLRFPIDHVVVYGWSIGGFTATWAAMTHPDLGALVLDATFDDLVPLALKVMPSSWKGLVVRTVRRHFNLNIADQLCRYPGPVLLIRRTQDDVVTTKAPGGPGSPSEVEGNRGNRLLLRLLQHRYPHVMVPESVGAVNRWLAAANLAHEEEMYRHYRVDDTWCLAILKAYRDRAWPDGGRGHFPWSVGVTLPPKKRRQLALFLARKHLKNVEATHCCPLEPEEFQLPWTLDAGPETGAEGQR
ncbi:protein ABHD16B isoform X3 [Ornithorhynchus anatinus]|uniref:protein ABHD16B isoform X3 n=1 Tax=Ornithorhynchus anatinus TaxID=9258 RepID=UPI0010A75778|nr:protein ABHD16B isoform X3 [Ornithorhynchus anatinus]